MHHMYHFSSAPSQFPAQTKVILMIPPSTYTKLVPKYIHETRQSAIKAFWNFSSRTKEKPIFIRSASSAQMMHTYSRNLHSFLLSIVTSNSSAAQLQLSPHHLCSIWALPPAGWYWLRPKMAIDTTNTNETHLRLGVQIVLVPHDKIAFHCIWNLKLATTVTPLYPAGMIERSVSLLNSFCPSVRTLYIGRSYYFSPS